MPAGVGIAFDVSRLNTSFVLRGAVRKLWVHFTRTFGIFRFGRYALTFVHIVRFPRFSPYYCHCPLKVLWEVPSVADARLCQYLRAVLDIWECLLQYFVCYFI